MSVKQIPGSEKQMFEKTLLSLITNLEEKKGRDVLGYNIPVPMEKFSGIFSLISQLSGTYKPFNTSG